MAAAAGSELRGVVTGGEESSPEGGECVASGFGDGGEGITVLVFLALSFSE